jgi:hypothetical protein
MAMKSLSHAPIMLIQPLPVTKIFSSIVDALHGDVPGPPQCFYDHTTAIVPNNDSLRPVWQSLRQVKIHFAVLNRYHITKFAWPEPHLHPAFNSTPAKSGRQLAEICFEFPWKKNYFSESG